MKRFTKYWGGAFGVFLLFTLFAFNAKGQATYYYASLDGSGNAPCALATPCSIDNAIAAATSNGDIVLIEVRRVGGTVTIDADVMFPQVDFTLGVFERRLAGPKRGTINFTGSVTMRNGLTLHKDATVGFTNIKLIAARNFSDPVSINHLITTGDLKIDRDESVNDQTFLVTDSVTVNAGHTLTLSENANLRVRLSAQRSTADTAPTPNPVLKLIGKFEVKGTIKGDGNILISHTPDERDEIELHAHKEYQPGAKLAVKDCMLLNGGGMIHSTLLAHAAGNICVSLKEIGTLIATGSITNDMPTDSITTDVIFRDAITVKGDVVQWRDAKITFEKDATIEGDVTATSGLAADGTTNITPTLLLELGNGNAGVYGSLNPYEILERNNAVGDHPYEVFGIDFQGASNTIEGDLRVNFSTSDLNQHRVRFLADSDIDSGKDYTTTVEGDVLITAGPAEIHLQGHENLDDNERVQAKVTTHSLAIEGDIFADETATILQDAAADSHLSGDDLCSAPGLRAGNTLTLSGDVVVAPEKTLGANAVVIDGNVEVTGTLLTNTVHIADGKLESTGAVQIGVADGTPGELILEDNGLEGTLAAESNVQHLTYATIDSDDVTYTEIAKLAMNIGNGRELRTRGPVTVTNLGLCSGNMVLIATGDEKTNTVTVSEMIHVDDGQITTDTNRPGDLVGDGDATKPTDTYGYILKYVTDAERTATASELAGAHKLVVEHKDAVIIVNQALSLIEGVHIFNGHLHLKGDASTLTIGSMAGVADVNPILTIDEGEFHTNGNNVPVYGTVTVGKEKKTAKIMTDGGEVHVLGQFTSKNLDNATAVAMLGENGMIDVGNGALQIGPETTNPIDGLHGDWEYPIQASPIVRPHVKLDLHEKARVKGTIRVPKGSKQTELIGAEFETIVFDGTKTPEKAAKPADENWEGNLYISPVAGDGKSVIVDSLNASNGGVEFYGTKFTINKNVEVSSARLYLQGNEVEFKGDLAISKTGGFSSRGGTAEARHKVTIGGDFSQETEQKEGAVDMNTPQGATYLSAFTDLIVTGDFTTSGAGTAERFGATTTTNIHLNKGFNFGLAAKDYVLNANLEFSGKEVQEISAAGIDLHHVTVDGAGLSLGSNISQAATAELTLDKGHIAGDFTWTVKNAGIETNLINRLNAQTGNRCGDDGDQLCTSVINKGSRNSLVSAELTRHIQHGNDGENASSAGGYLFPVGSTVDSKTYYRPLILQLPVDLDAEAPITVSPTTIPSGATPEWSPIQAVTGGTSLSLDVYAPDIFWKVDLGKDADPLTSNLNLRVSADGIVNVSDVSGLRIVQWDCEWQNPRLAGRYEVVEAGTFAVNGYVGRAANVTQLAVDVETCSIFGIAANSIENSIHQQDFGGAISRIQFIHNAQIQAPVALSLDGVEIADALTRHSATGYLRTGAGRHEAVIAPAGAPEAQHIEVPFSVDADKSYALIAHGTPTDLKVKQIETRLASRAANMVDVIVVHGRADVGAVRVQLSNILDDPRTSKPTKLLASGLGFDRATSYQQLSPEFHRIEVLVAGDKVGVFDVDLAGYSGETLILNLSIKEQKLYLYGVDINGEEISAAVVTNVDSDITELPTEFALHGNYPNPFNPSTRIQFDLPESAQVSLQVVDMLGREVMVLPAQDFEAGANRSIELNATNLASGTYLYRMIATGAESRHVKTGRMTLVK